MNQTTIKRFRLYLSEVICYYHRYGTLRGFSVLASKHKTSQIPSEMFFQAGLDKMPMGSVPSMEACLEILQNIDLHPWYPETRAKEILGLLNNEE